MTRHKAIKVLEDKRAWLERRVEVYAEGTPQRKTMAEEIEAMGIALEDMRACAAVERIAAGGEL